MSSSSPPEAPASLLAPEAPYRGLIPYSEQDAPLFFGREDECDVVINNLLASRVTLLYGASGVGKTSLLRAGVTHELLALSRRNVRNYGSPEHVVVYFNRWSDDPVAALSRRIHDSVATAMGGHVQEPEVRSPGLVETLHEWTTSLGSDLLIILDQFEEYFLYHPDDDGDGSFAVEFPRAINRPDLRVSFLVAIREDALARLDRFKGRIPNLFDNYLRTKHLDADAARAAIEKPLEAYNRLVSAEEPFRAEPELVQAVLDQVQIGKVVLGAAGRGMVEKSTGQDVTGQRIETPYLQLVLTRLWREEIATGSHTLRAETLQRLGGAQQIVHTHLDEALRALPARQQDVAAGIFHHLVTPSGTKIAHTAPDLADYAQLPRAEVESVLQELSSGDARILRPIPPPSGRPHAEPAYEIFHDVLAPAILEWRASHVVAQVTEEQLHQARRRLRRLGSLAAALGILLIAAVAFAVLALYQSHQADVQRQRAMTQTRLAASRQLTAEAAATLDDDPRTALLLGIAAEHFHDDVTTRTGLVNSLIATRYAGTLAGHTLPVDKVAFSQDGRTLATASDDKTVRIYSIGDPARPVPLGRPLTGHNGTVTSVAFSPNGHLLATAGADKRVLIWKMRNPARPALLGRPLTGHNAPVYSVAFSPDGHLLATGSGDHTVRLWKLSGSASPVPFGRPLTGHSAAVYSVAFNPDGDTLATAGYDTVTMVWKVGRPPHTAQLAQRLTGYHAAVYSVAFSPDGRTLAIAGAAGTATLWHLGGPVYPALLGPPFGGGQGEVASLAFSPTNPPLATSGDLLATGDDVGTIRLWSVSQENGSAALGPPFGGGQGEVASLAFSPDGHLLAAGGGSGSTQLWDVRRVFRPVAIGPLLRSGDAVAAVAFSRDRHLLASGGDDEVTRVWNVHDPDHPILVGAPLDGHQKEVASLAFSPDGHLLASGGGNGVTQLWDVRDASRPEPIGPPLKGHVGALAAVAFSPDGQTVASGGDDGATLLVDVHDPHNPVAVGPALRGHTDAVTSLAFTRDGRRLAIGSSDETVLVWGLASLNELRNYPVERACALTGRGLSHEEWAAYVSGLPYEGTCPNRP